MTTSAFRPADSRLRSNWGHAHNVSVVGFSAIISRVDTEPAISRIKLANFLYRNDHGPEKRSITVRLDG